jgi:hypothetical protein
VAEGGVEVVGGVLDQLLDTSHHCGHTRMNTRGGDSVADPPAWATHRPPYSG